mgnify:FL=1|jgi:hypothetical protein
MFTQREVVFKMKIKTGIVYYFMAFVFLFFTSTLNIKTTRPPLIVRSTQENLILLHEKQPIQNYVSANLTDNGNTDVAVWRDFLPEVLIESSVQEEKIITHEKIENKQYKKPLYTILSRYRERVLRI